MRPEVESLLSETRAREQLALVRKERATYAGFSAAFLIAAGALALLAPATREFEVLPTALLVLAYAAVARIEFAAGAGIVVPTQVKFDPQLLLLPTPWVPLLVSAALVLTDTAQALKGERSPQRALAALSDAWFSVPPALVLVLADAQVPSWEDAPWYAVALAAQLGG